MQTFPNLKLLHFYMHDENGEWYHLCIAIGRDPRDPQATAFRVAGRGRSHVDARADAIRNFHHAITNVTPVPDVRNEQNASTDAA